jgi:DNA-binding transcriptional MerR regulator
MGARNKSGKETEVLIPDKLYFRIGEVARLADLPTYVLRFWETEFPQLKPVKSSTGQRMYRKREVELALHIKELLYEQGFTIPGAREQLKAEARPDKQAEPASPTKPSPDHLKHVRHGLREILAILERTPEARHKATKA